MTRSLAQRNVDPFPWSPEPGDEPGGVTLIVLAVSGPVDDTALGAIGRRVDAPADQLLRLIRAEPATTASPGPHLVAARSEPGVLEVGPLRMDLDQVRVTLDGRAVQLTHQEFLMLKAFLQHPGWVLSRAQLLELAWDYRDGAGERTVDVRVRRVRVKLGPDAPPIVTVRGFGYRLEPALGTPGPSPAS